MWILTCPDDTMCRVCIVQIQCRKYVLDDADHTACTWQHEVDHTCKSWNSLPIGPEHKWGLYLVCPTCETFRAKVDRKKSAPNFLKCHRVLYYSQFLKVLSRTVLLYSEFLKVLSRTRYWTTALPISWSAVAYCTAAFPISWHICLVLYYSQLIKVLSRTDLLPLY